MLVECIRRNLADEIAAGRVVVSAKGVWDRSGELTLFGDRSAGAGNSFVAHGSDLEAIGQIPVTTIDTLVSELELPRVDFIKADVKGATERMILGAIETLARYRPRMALSTEEPPEDPQQLVQVLLGRRPRLSIHLRALPDAGRQASLHRRSYFFTRRRAEYRALAATNKSGRR